MYSAQLRVDTSYHVPSYGARPFGGQNGDQSRLASPPPFASNSSTAPGGRMRSTSSASSTSTLSIVSPAPSSNASTSSLQIPDAGTSGEHTRTPSPTSPALDETVRVGGSEYVLAMHDYTPENETATCLSFVTGQVIHVLNRDRSGWWDGELDGRRGWFPSNYVNDDVNSIKEEELPRISQRQRVGHLHTMSTVSVTSWASTPSPMATSFKRNDHRPSVAENLGPDTDTYCPPMMVPLLHGLSLLQSAVRSNRVAHFQPSTACIISCVRSVLSATECLPREAPLLKRYDVLAQERKKILSVLASLVSQSKLASEDSAMEDQHEADVELMLRLGGQVFAHVRRFLAIAVQCGVDLPERRPSVSAVESADSEPMAWSRHSEYTPPNMDSVSAPYATNEDATARLPTGGFEPQTPASRRRQTSGTPGSGMRARSMVDLRNQRRVTMEDDAAPLLPHRTVVSRAKREQYLAKQPSMAHKAGASISSVSSSSTASSLDSVGTPTSPEFPTGPCSAQQVMEALRHTHDNYLSTIAAFIGHAHSHSRTSHASSTGHMYDLVREIVEMVCKLLTIVEAVIRHPDVPQHKLGSLRAAKEGLYNVTSSLAESVRLLTMSSPTTLTEDEESTALLRSATGALKAGADCVAAVKMCLTRSAGERPFIIQLPGAGDANEFTPSNFAKPGMGGSKPVSALDGLHRVGDAAEDDLTILAQSASPGPTPGRIAREMYDEPERTPHVFQHPFFGRSEDVLSPSLVRKAPPPLSLAREGVQIDASLPSPMSSIAPSFARTERTDDDRTTWEGSVRGHRHKMSIEEKLVRGDLPSIPMEPVPELPSQDQGTYILPHDYLVEDVAYNSEGHLVGATLNVLVEKMTPHDSIVDPAFSAVFFMTFRLFSSPMELVEAIIARYNIIPPPNVSDHDLFLWQRSKGIPVRLRVSNFIKLWLEAYWRPSTDNIALDSLRDFTRDGLAPFFAGPSQRILELIDLRATSPSDAILSPVGDRNRDPGMVINPPSATASEIPRPTMTKALLASLRSRNFAAIAITDFDTLELARQLSIMENLLYCAIQPEEVLETGQEGATPPVNVKAVSSISTVITGWVAESILNEKDTKKRTLLIKFFIKVADRCTSLHNYSTPRAILAALDSSTISRLHQTWSGLPQKNRAQLEVLRRLADHGRNYREYRTKLRNTAPPAVPFLGLYLTDVTFCREGNPSHRASPMAPDKKLLNFNKYHKLARIVQDMQRFQVPYNLKAIPEVQDYLRYLFEKSKHHGDLQDLYRRSLLVEPKRPADSAPTNDMGKLFGWASRSQASQQASPA